MEGSGHVLALPKRLRKELSPRDPPSPGAALQSPLDRGQARSEKRGLPGGRSAGGCGAHTRRFPPSAQESGGFKSRGITCP